MPGSGQRFHPRKKKNRRSARPITGIAMLACCALILGGCKEEHALDRRVEGETRGKVSLGVIHHTGEGATQADEDEGGERLLLRGERYEVAFEELAIVVADVEVHACLTEISGWFDALSPVSVAHAHVPESATRLGTPTVEDLLSPPGRARILGEVAPPLGSYCKLRVVLAGADEDVVNLSGVETQRLQGKSVVMRGRWRARLRDGEEGEPTWRAFDVTGLKEAMIWEIELGEAPITLTKEKSGAFVLVDKQISGDLADVMGRAFKGSKTGDAEQVVAATLRYLGAKSSRYVRTEKP